MTRIDIAHECFVDAFENDEDEFCIAFDETTDDETIRWVMPFTKAQLTPLVAAAKEYLGMADDHK